MTDLGFFDSAVPQALRDAIRYQREHREREDWAGQIGIYRAAARRLRLDLGSDAPLRPAPLADGREVDAADVALIVIGLRRAAWLLLDRNRACQTCEASDDEPCREHAADSASVDAWRELAERLDGGPR